MPTYNLQTKYGTTTVTLSLESEHAALVALDLKPSELHSWLATQVELDTTNRLQSLLDAAAESYSALDAQVIDAYKNTLAVSGPKEVKVPKSYSKRTKAPRYCGSRLAKAPTQDYEAIAKALQSQFSGRLVHWGSEVKAALKSSYSDHQTAAEILGYLLQKGYAKCHNFSHKETSPNQLSGEYIFVKGAN
jgi:hypothetical protein